MELAPLIIPGNPLVTLYSHQINEFPIWLQRPMMIRVVVTTPKIQIAFIEAALAGTLQATVIWKSWNVENVDSYEEINYFMIPLTNMKISKFFHLSGPLCIRIPSHLPYVLDGIARFPNELGVEGPVSIGENQNAFFLSRLWIYDTKWPSFIKRIAYRLRELYIMASSNYPMEIAYFPMLERVFAPYLKVNIFKCPQLRAVDAHIVDVRKNSNINLLEIKCKYVVSWGIAPSKHLRNLDEYFAFSSFNCPQLRTIKIEDLHSINEEGDRIHFSFFLTSVNFDLIQEAYVDGR